MYVYSVSNTFWLNPFTRLQYPGVIAVKGESAVSHEYKSKGDKKNFFFLKAKIVYFNNYV